MPRSLEQWLAHQEKVHWQTIDLGLERLQETLARLHWRQPSVPVITVGGTNGKGSVTAYCASILGAAGYRVGSFTSPHLRDYRERLRIHDRWVTAAELVWAFERIEAARLGVDPVEPSGEPRADAAASVGVGRLGGEASSSAVERPSPQRRELSLTFFEYNALAAFLIFEETAMDAWVLEVGMGGRLDAANAVDPTVAVVVGIGLDHQEFLGTSVEAIAREKAGIFRKDRVAVIGSRTVPATLGEVALSMGAPLKRLGVEFDFAREPAGELRDTAPNELRANAAGEHRREPTGWRYHGTRWDLVGLPRPALAGATQFGNAATAIAAIEALESRVRVSPAAITEGLRSVQLAGRFQVIAPPQGQPGWILDVAHNPDAARVMAENLREHPSTGKTLAVCGILADKDALGIAHELRGCFDTWWVVSMPGVRGTTAAALAERIAAEVAVPLLRADDVVTACAAARAAAGAQDRIVVFGSFHTVGPALDWLESQRLVPPPALPEYTDAPH